MKDGQAIFNTRPGGVQVISLAASRSQPLTLAQATTAIEQFLLNERKRKLVADDLAALRSVAKIEYLGDFAEDAAKHPYRAASAPELPPIATMPATLPASEVSAAPQIEVPPIGSAAGSMPSSATLDKGLGVLK
jgi:hypothetical protein